MMRWVALFVLAVCSSVHAADDSELQRLNTLLNVLNQEQQALVQQLTITQDMRRSNTQMLCNGQLMPPGVMDYDDWVAAQRDSMRREDALRNQIDQIYARWNELETSKRPVLQRIYELASPKQE
jgi:hypothetical protein